MILLSF